MWWSGAKNGWISVYGGGHPIRSRSARARTFGGQNLATSVLAPKSSRQSSPRHVLHKPNQFWAFFISNSKRFDNTLIKFELLGRIEWKKSKLQISNTKPKLNANQEWYTHFAKVPGLSARFTVRYGWTDWLKPRKIIVRKLDNYLELGSPVARYAHALIRLTMLRERHFF